MKKNTSNKYFMSFMNEVIDLQQKENRPGTAGSYRNTFHSFSSFLNHFGHRDIRLSKVDAEMLSDYQDWLFGEGRSRNTVACHMRNLRATYNQALRTVCFLLQRQAIPLPTC